MEDLSQTMSEIPWPGLVPVALLLFVGLVLWVAGRRVLRTSFAAAGLVAGGSLGWMAADLDVLARINPPAWALAVAGAFLLAIFAALLYRLVLAASIAVLLGTLCPLTLWAAVELDGIRINPSDDGMTQSPLYASQLQDADEGAVTDLDGLVEWVLALPGGRAETAQDTEDAPDATEAAEPAGEAGDETTERSWSEWREWWQHITLVARELPGTVWESSTGPVRWSLLASAAVGTLLGLLLGAAAPVFSAAVVTSLGGSIMLLGSAWTLATSVVPQGWWMPGTPTQWLIWWLAFSIIGLVVQWTLRARRADKPAD